MNVEWRHGAADVRRPLNQQISENTGHGAGQGGDKPPHAHALAPERHPRSRREPGDQTTAVEPGGDSALTTGQAGNSDFAPRANGTVKGPAGMEDASSAAVIGLPGGTPGEGKGRL